MVAINRLSKAKAISDAEIATSAVERATFRRKLTSTAPDFFDRDAASEEKDTPLAGYEYEDMHDRVCEVGEV
jgi:hypothetical protein